MPGPYSSFMVFRRRASLVFLLTSNKAYRTRRDAARAVGTRDFVRSACSRRHRVPHNLPNFGFGPAGGDFLYTNCHEGGCASLPPVP